MCTVDTECTMLPMLIFQMTWTIVWDLVKFILSLPYAIQFLFRPVPNGWLIPDTLERWKVYAEELASHAVQNLQAQTGTNDAIG